MAFHDHYRIGAHAVITNTKGQVLLLKASYANYAWGLPGGGVDPNETIVQALVRECHEELNLNVQVDYLSGIYLHRHIQAHVHIFKCTLPQHANITLSEEHLEYRYFSLEELSAIQQQRVADCLNFSGQVIFRTF